MKKRNRTDAEWLELCEARKRNGLSRKAWCRKEGVEYRSFTDWEYRSRKKANNGVTGAGATRAERTGTVSGKPESSNHCWVEFAPAAVAAGVSGLDGKISEAAGIQISIGAFRIILPEVFAEGAFKRVCKALSEIC